MPSLRKLGKLYGLKTFTWHSGVKKDNKKRSGKVARTRLKRELLKDIDRE